MHALKKIIPTAILALACFSNLGLGQSANIESVQNVSDFRFVQTKCDISEDKGCFQSTCVLLSFYQVEGNTLVNQMTFCIDDSVYNSKKFLELDDYNFDGFMDFRMITRKQPVGIEKQLAKSDYIFDIDYYMFDVTTNKFQRHFISALRNVQINRQEKSAKGTLYDLMNDSRGIKPTTYIYELSGTKLKYFMITPASYSETHRTSSNYNSSYHILENGALRSVDMRDTLTELELVKYVDSFKFVKSRQLHTANIDPAKNPNFTYKTMFRVYNTNNGQLLSEIVGGYDFLFVPQSDSIYTNDYNFDSHSDLEIQYDWSNGQSVIYFYDAEKKKFFKDGIIESLENRKIDLKNRSITGKVTSQAMKLIKYGQFREPRKKEWREYEFIGPALKYVKI